MLDIAHSDATISEDSLNRFLHHPRNSMKTIAQKMYVKPGMKLRVLSKPKNFDEIFGVHEAEMLSDRSKDLSDIAILFVNNKSDLVDKLAKSTDKLKPGGVLWVAYPKGSSKLKSDINRDSIREFAETVKLEAVSIVAINEDWSCLRFKAMTDA